MNEKTIFHKIIKKEIPSLIIYEDEDYIVILDAFPKQQGHTLIIPKEEGKNILKNTKEIRSSILEIAKTISDKLIEKLNASGVKIVTNVGKSAGQVIFHTHMHLIPYYDNDQEKINNEEVLNKILK